MECLYPQRRTVLRNGTEFVLGYRCGHCVPCGIEKREAWAGRILLEAQAHAASSFVTLTYDDYHLPDDESVSKREMQLWLKRLRARYSGYRFRYFLVGEYGEHTQRPHYHAVIFGLPWTEQATVQATWELGFTSVYELNPSRARYVASYTVKKMVPELAVQYQRETGVLLAPEFALMSRRPGVAHGSVEVILENARKSKFSFHRGVYQTDPVTGVGRRLPGYFRFEGKKYPLSRYLEGKLNECIDSVHSERNELRRLVVDHSAELSRKTASARQIRQRKRNNAAIRADRIRAQRKGVL